MRQQRSFTIVELLVVITIFSVLSLAVYATFSSGMRLWQRIQGVTLSQRRVLLGLERLSSDLRQALNFPNIGFTGKTGEISFPILSGLDISKATYSLAQKTLFRKQERYKDILDKKEQGLIKKLIPEIEDLKFNFAYQEQGKTEYSWKDTWGKEEGLPIIIKIELKTQNANFSKAIILPVS